MRNDLAEDIISVSDFRKNTSSYLREIRSKDRCVVLTQNGHSVAIVMSPETFEKMRYERELFAAIAQGENEISDGKGISHAEVFQDILKQYK